METVNYSDIFTDYIWSEYKQLGVLDQEKLEESCLSYLKDSKSLYACIAYEQSKYFEINTNFIAILFPCVSEISILLVYEILHANKIGILADDFAKGFIKEILEDVKDVGRIAREVCECIGFVFTDKSYKKNSLFRVHEGVYSLSPFPIFDSVCSLLKERDSKKYLPSNLIVGRVSKVNKFTVVGLLSKLKYSSSSVTVLTTLQKFLSLYDEECDLGFIFNRLPRNRISNAPRVSVLTKEIVSELELILSEKETDRSDLMKLVTSI